MGSSAKHRFAFVFVIAAGRGGLHSVLVSRQMVFKGGLALSRIILADLKGRGGYVNKDTVAGGYGSRFQGHSFTTRFEKNLRRVLQNLPSIHI